MSIHDKYFSKENKNHMYHVLKDLILKETSYDIDTNPQYIDFYRFKYRTIFEKIDAEELVELNKALIDEIGNLFINDIKSKYAEKQIQIEKDIPITTYEKEEVIKKEIHLNSLTRNSDSLNRYNYSIDLPDNINKIGIKEFIIPDENNVLFQNPIICIQIQNKDKTTDNYLSLNKNITIKDKKYHIYHPTTKLVIPKEEDTIQIKILNNIKQEILKKSDKIHIDKIKIIKHKEKQYLSLVTNRFNIVKDDTISIYCENKLIGTFLISKVIQNYLLIEDETILYDKTKKYYFLLTNLQNNLILDCYLS